MEWNVYEGETEVGVLSAECCGKTLYFRGVFPKITGIHRLYLLLEDGEILPLGVPIPADEGLKLCRSLRRRDAEQLPARLRRAVLCPGDSRPQLPAEPVEKSPEIPAAAPQDRDEKPAVCGFQLSFPEKRQESAVFEKSIPKKVLQKRKIIDIILE